METEKESIALDRVEKKKLLERDYCFACIIISLLINLFCSYLFSFLGVWLDLSVVVALESTSVLFLRPGLVGPTEEHVAYGLFGGVVFAS